MYVCTYIFIYTYIYIYMRAAVKISVDYFSKGGFSCVEKTHQTITKPCKGIGPLPFVVQGD